MLFPGISRVSFVAPAAMESALRFIRRPTRELGHGLNLHRSNRAKNGLFHGKDIMFGNNISHSGRKTRRTWKPNVVSKRVWSDAMNDWVRFSMTTRAMKEIDNIGGIDTYLLRLDEASVQDSKYVTRMRDTIAAKLFHKGELDEKVIKKLGFHKAPPVNIDTVVVAK